MLTKVIVERPTARLCRLLPVLVFLWATKAMADPGADLIAAATHGDVAAVQALLAQGAEVDAKDDGGMTPLMWASEEGHLDVVQVLITKGADVNAKEIEGGGTALKLAKDADIKSLLVRAGAKQ